MLVDAERPLTVQVVGKSSAQVLARDQDVFDRRAAEQGHRSWAQETLEGGRVPVLPGVRRTGGPAERTDHPHQPGRRGAQPALVLQHQRQEHLATLPSGRTPTKKDWSRLSQVWCTGLDHRIAQLQKLRDTL